MASGLSVYAANKINDYLLRGTAFSVPATFYIALYEDGAQTALRNDDMASADVYEVVPPNNYGYVRLAIDKSTRTFSVSSGGLSENTATWAWDECTLTWGTVKTAALVDVSTGTSGHIWYYGDLTAAKLVSPPDIFRFLTGAFDIQL